MKLVSAKCCGAIKLRPANWRRYDLASPVRNACVLCRRRYLNGGASRSGDALSMRLGRHRGLNRGSRENRPSRNSLIARRSKQSIMAGARLPSYCARAAMAKYSGTAPLLWRRVATSR